MYPINCRVLYFPGGAGFCPSTVFTLFNDASAVSSIDFIYHPLVDCVRVHLRYSYASALVKIILCLNICSCACVSIFVFMHVPFIYIHIFIYDIYLFLNMLMNVYMVLRNS